MSCCFLQPRAMDCGDLTRHKLLRIYFEYTKICRQHHGAEPPEWAQWGAANSNGNRRQKPALMGPWSQAIFLKRRNCLPRCWALLRPWLWSGSWRRGTMGELKEIKQQGPRARLAWALRDDQAAKLWLGNLCEQGRPCLGSASQAFLTPAARNSLSDCKYRLLG